MKYTRKRKLLLGAIIGVAALVLVLVCPGPIEGCYLETGDEFNSTAGYSFTFFYGGKVYSCNEYRSNASFLGEYTYKANAGWIWSLNGSSKRVYVHPRLFYATFRAVDSSSLGVTATFQWRDPRLKKTRHILESLNLKEKAP